MARVHIQEIETEGVVPLDVELADVGEPEAEVADRVVGGGRGPAPRVVGVAVGQGERAVGVLAPQPEGVAVA